MGFNSHPASRKPESEEEVASTWYLDEEAWADLRAGRMAESLDRGSASAQASGGYVRSINYSVEVLRRWK